ncbi:MAG: hypothetical protein M3325_02425 [Actinomycetota bacterium]|nr:hypothetical protein [Actinomycetota bacterium]
MRWPIMLVTSSPLTFGTQFAQAQFGFAFLCAKPAGGSSRFPGTMA